MRYALDDMSKISALHVLSTRGSTQKAVKYGRGESSRVIAPDHDFPFANRALPCLSPVVRMQGTSRKRESVTLVIRRWRYCPASHPGHLSDLVRATARDRAKRTEEGKRGPVFLHITVDNGAEYSCNISAWQHVLGAIFASCPEIGVLCCGAYAPYHSAMHYEAESLWGDIKPSLHGLSFGGAARDEIASAVCNSEEVKTVIRGAMSEFGEHCGSVVSRNTPFQVVFRSNNKWPGRRGAGATSGDQPASGRQLDWPEMQTPDGQPSVELREQPAPLGGGTRPRRRTRRP